MKEETYQKNVIKNYQFQKIAYIVTLVTFIGLVLWIGVSYFLLRPALGEEIFKRLATAFAITALILVFCFLCIDMILGTIAFMLCKKSTKKYMEDPQKIQQYKICMGISYGILTLKILYLFSFDSVVTLGMIIFYAIVVVKGVRSTYFN